MMNTETTDKTATVAEQGATDAPAKVSPKKGTTQKKGSPKAKKSASAAAPKKAKAGEEVAAKPERNAPRPESNGAKILEMIERAKGATLAEIMKATDWQAHSVRGFISTAGKKNNITIASPRNEAGERLYKMAK